MKVKGFEKGRKRRGDGWVESSKKKQKWKVK